MVKQSTPVYRTLQRAGMAIALALVTLAAGATPPPWAPAWGYRGHAPAVRHYQPPRQYYRHAPPPALYAPPRGYRSGVMPRRGRSGGYTRCGEPLFGGALGGALGGFAGSQIGRGDGRLAATAAGTLLGYTLGRNIAGRCGP